MFVGENHPYRAASQYGPRLLNSSRGKVSDFTQRIMSAKLLRVKELRNQVNLMQHQINVCFLCFCLVSYD